MAFMSGNLCYQIEHHLFPDLPSNRYPEIAERVRGLCVTYDLPYTTGSLLRQYLLTVRTIWKLALPDRFLFATSDDAPETASEDRFRNAAKRPPLSSGIGDGARRRGLATAILARGNRSRLTTIGLAEGSGCFRVPVCQGFLRTRDVLRIKWIRRRGEVSLALSAKPQLPQHPPMRGERQRDRVAPWRNPAE